MTSTSDGKYRRKQVSIQYRYSDIHSKIPITNFTSTNQSHNTTFGLTNFLGFFNICPVSKLFPFQIFFLSFLITIPVTIPSIDTQRYRKVLIQYLQYRYSFAPLIQTLHDKSCLLCYSLQRVHSTLFQLILNHSIQICTLQVHQKLLCRTVLNIEIYRATSVHITPRQLLNMKGLMCGIATSY